VSCIRLPTSPITYGFLRFTDGLVQVRPRTWTEVTKGQVKDGQVLPGMVGANSWAGQDPVGINPLGRNSWPSDGARPWLSAAAATRTSTLADPPRPARNDHWIAGCEETREETDGKGPG
jgi:hypothetical protein